ncbi:hypothetical protein GEV33_012964 [Tenebrio molitor]|uniref:Uncharacterized protein n=1 Tax=Tenebrio molitor TaxID=7067 RepID=A0A8J6H9D9_TENMO|nr:hypothetical protein GEV33_012964 [Tenebrio molitor]
MTHAAVEILIFTRGSLEFSELQACGVRRRPLEALKPRNKWQLQARLDPSRHKKHFVRLQFDPILTMSRRQSRQTRASARQSQLTRQTQVGHSVNYNKSVMGLAIVASDSESLILPMKIKRRGGECIWRAGLFIQLTAGRKWGTAFYSDGCGSRRERTVAPKEESRAQARDATPTGPDMPQVRNFADTKPMTTQLQKYRWHLQERATGDPHCNYPNKRQQRGRENKNRRRWTAETATHLAEVGGDSGGTGQHSIGDPVEVPSHSKINHVHQ